MKTGTKVAIGGGVAVGLGLLIWWLLRRRQDAAPVDVASYEAPPVDAPPATPPADTYKPVYAAATVQPGTFVTAEVLPPVVQHVE